MCVRLLACDMIKYDRESLISRCAVEGMLAFKRGPGEILDRVVLPLPLLCNGF